MKNKLNKQTFRVALAAAAFCMAFWSCKPDNVSYFDNDVVDVSAIKSVAISPNNKLLIADGKAALDLKPLVYTKAGNLIPNHRVKDEWLEYTADTGTPVTRFFATSDASLIGKTLSVSVKIKGTQVMSEPVKVTIVAPLAEQHRQIITIPVVFHIVQTKDDVEKYGGEIKADRIALILNKLNNVFGGKAAVNPVGVDTYIRFELAKFSQYGNKMPEPGINRAVVAKIDTTKTGRYNEFLATQRLVWSAEKYMNIWLISDLDKKYPSFGGTISSNCQPAYHYSGVSPLLPGLTLVEKPANKPFTVNQSGIIYRLQELEETSRVFGSLETPANNELIYYVGRYLGLLPTFAYSISTPAPDYCDDTLNYFVDTNAPSNNMGINKYAEGIYFRSENIMDDPTGIHVFVTKNQTERMRWVLQNCPDRAAWKNPFAFTGQ